MVRIFLMSFFILATLPPESQANESDSFIDHCKVKARSGDGIITLLKRYALYHHACNREAFYRDNQITSESSLYAGKEYILPIRIYRYNRTSIRSTIGIDDWDQAVSIAEYNQFLQKAGLKSTYYMDDAILWVPHHLFNCAADLPSGSRQPVVESVKEEIKTYLHNPLFGDHSRFEKESDELKDHAYYIVSGHGGPDPGAMCSDHASPICEDEYAYDVSLRLQRKLEANGAKVFMIIQDLNDGIRNQSLLDCDRDEICMGEDAVIPLKQLARLKQRSDATNDEYQKHKSQYKVHRMIAIHVDSRPKDKRQDVFFYHCPGSEEGKRIAENIQDVFREKYKIHRPNGEYHGTVTERNLYVLRNTDPPAVYVELANIKNPIDQGRILMVSNREALAKWLYLGLTK